jgi:hypothetical protein
VLPMTTKRRTESSACCRRSDIPTWFPKCRSVRGTFCPANTVKVLYR